MDATIIHKYFPELSEKQGHLIKQLYPLYKAWNEKINVISRKDIDQLYERHVLHSLAIAKFIRFAPDTDILDLGTGGGFPGLPLAILFPESNFHLVDAVGKKISVAKAVADALELKNLTTLYQRAEKVKGQFDFIVSRAVSRTKQLFIWSNKKIKNEHRHHINNGLILLKGGDLKEEMEEFKRPYTVTRLCEYFNEAFFETKKIIHIPVNDPVKYPFLS